MNNLSIIVLTYNSEKYIAKCLDAIIENSSKKDEIIVIDNNSTDNTLDILKKYKKDIRLFKVNKNVGISEGRNIGCKYSKNDILVFIDSDIILNEDSITHGKDAFIKYNADALVGIYKEYGDGLNWHPEYNRDLFASKRRKDFKREITFKNYTTFSGGLCMIKKDIFQKYYGFDIKFNGGSCEDIKLELMMIKDGRKIIFERGFNATHCKSYMSFKGLMKRSLNSGRGLGNLIKSIKTCHYKIPFNRQWPYLPISVPIEILLLFLSIFNHYFFILFLILFLYRCASVIFNGNDKLTKKILFLILRVPVDMAMFYSMIKTLLKKGCINDIKYEVKEL